MSRKNLYKRFLLIFLALDFFAIIGLGYSNLNSLIPNELKLTVDNAEKINLNLPLDFKIYTKDVDVLSIDSKKLSENQINKNNSFIIESSEKGSYSIDLKLFGLIHLKRISLDVVDTVELIPCGFPIGIYVETDGILVLGTSAITCIDGLNYDPSNKVLKSGDYIVSINSKSVNDKYEFIEELKNCQGKEIILGIRRNDKNIITKVQPVKTSQNEYKIGVWIRDNTQGVGTLTFTDKNGNFGALGHGINDIDTSMLMDINRGNIYSAEILSIVKGKNGTPGELIGLFNYAKSIKIGSIVKNTQQGVFGVINENFKDYEFSQPMKVGFKQDVKLGKALLRCSVNGKIKDYNIEIEKIDISDSKHGKGMVVKITDEELLGLTNGIVQGMSGSPIIQDNKIIGAITHVFVQDSTKGYATFIENMIKAIN